MREPPCPHPHHPAGSGGSGLLVLLAVLAVLVLAAPQAHTLRPLVDQLRRAGPLPSVALPTPPPASRGGSDGRACPVRGRVRIGQGWGAPRDGGRRRHHGIDLLAPAGTPLVAVADGHITRASNVERGRGGISLWLRDRRGTSYYYAHNQRNLAQVGQRVRRGQVVALLGSTGNARGGPPHLHLQLHPGGGPPVNPDATVRRWC